jgi:hypothetical protein
MTMGTFKAIELILIAGAFLWFYSGQMRSVRGSDQARENEEAKDPSSTAQNESKTD